MSASVQKQSATLSADKLDVIPYFIGQNVKKLSDISS